MIKISECETIVNEVKFLETHKLRSSQIGNVNSPFAVRLEKYFEVKKQLNIKNETQSK